MQQGPAPGTFAPDLMSVAERFDWASRQGHPNWLWPEVAVDGWQAALCRIEAVTRQILTEGRADAPLTGPAPDVGVAAFTSGMGPLLAHWAEEGRIALEPAVADVLALHLDHNRRRMAALAGHAVATVEALADSGIRVGVLKGMHTAFACFPGPATRAVSDIDLLIDPADRPRANQVLAALGYLPGLITPVPFEQSWRHRDIPEEPQSAWLTHADNPWTIDLQSTLDRRYAHGAPTVCLDALSQAATTEPWPLSPRAYVLRPAALALHLACHASCGFESLTMARLVELVFVARSARFGWADFEELARRTGTLASAYPALRMCEQLCPGTVPAVVLESGERQAPPAVLRVIGRLTPADCHRVVRCALDERFMWTPSWVGIVRQVLFDMVMPHMPLRELARIYRFRIWRLLRGTVTRGAPNRA